MIPLRLNITGFLSYRDSVELDFSSFDLACISGSNGAGKSSLLDAMTWSLFGESRTRDKDALIHLGEKSAQVIFTFSYEGNEYQTQRSLTRGKATVLEFWVRDGDEWRALTEKTARETQERIEQTLRMDYETFVNASFFLQGKADEFTQKKASDRKAVLSNILGLEVWETYKDRAAEHRKAVERDVTKLEGSLAEIESELSEAGVRTTKLLAAESALGALMSARSAQESALEGIRKVSAALDQRLAAEKARLEEEQRGLREQEKTAREQAASLGKLSAEIEKTKNMLVEVEGKITSRQALEEERNQAREEISTLKAEDEARRAEIEKLRARVAQLQTAQGATCPLCGQELNEAHRDTTLTQLKKEGNELLERLGVVRSKMDELAKGIAELDAQTAKLINAERERLTLATSATQLTERLDGATKSAAQWEGAGAARLREVESILASEEHARAQEKPAVSLAEAERQLLRLREQENEARDEATRARQRVDILETLRERKLKLGAEREEKQQTVAQYKSLERAFGKDGVPALLIEQALPQIEEKANELLDRLSDGRMSIRFETMAKYKDAKRDDLKETLDIQISDGSGARDYEMYSGGEAFRVNFAIRLALSEVLAQRKGARLQTLVIDEGFGSQDTQGRQRLIEAINMVRGDFAKILVITHLDELKDAFPNRIEVEKGERGSTVRVI